MATRFARRPRTPPPVFLLSASDDCTHLQAIATPPIVTVPFPEVDDAECESPLMCHEGPSLILPGLYLGSHSDAQDPLFLRQAGIRHVLNMAQECEDTEAISMGLNVLHLPLIDHSDEPLGAYLPTATAFIYNALSRPDPEPVLVHCRVGVSRSASVVIAYLMLFGIPRPDQPPKQLTYHMAFDWVKRHRAQISPNLGFILTLRAMEPQRRSDDF
jgi:atypical dual specificity phosphatase